MNQRLFHDCALMGTEHCVGLLLNVLDETQQQQAREGIYEIIKACLEAYEVQADRMQKRLRPLEN